MRELNNDLSMHLLVHFAHGLGDGKLTCAPAAAASFTAFSAERMLIALSSPHKSWHAATENLGIAISGVLVPCKVLIGLELCRWTRSFPRLARRVKIAAGENALDDDCTARANRVTLNELRAENGLVLSPA